MPKTGGNPSTSFIMQNRFRSFLSLTENSYNDYCFCGLVPHEARANKQRKHTKQCTTAQHSASSPTAYNKTTTTRKAQAAPARQKQALIDVAASATTPQNGAKFLPAAKTPQASKRIAPAYKEQDSGYHKQASSVDVSVLACNAIQRRHCYHCKQESKHCLFSSAYSKCAKTNYTGGRAQRALRTYAR